ncbi:hypothetical protein [Paenibacillus odorifer]|uniref:hypothetical protein n=1 Tax=Paenibacillus TaxID=44249 RepID=UPI001BB0BF10
MQRIICGIETIVGLWGASYLVSTRDVTADTAALWISLYYGGITVGRLTTGFIALKVHNRFLIRYGQLVIIVGGVILLLPLYSSLSLFGFLAVRTSIDLFPFVVFALLTLMFLSTETINRLLIKPTEGRG